ncbi:DNA cytosine methyltransferase [Mycoplasma sp. SG1]|uniref:DNA cytosine methyltransferase n=1 Tax=Mycoplasma sp. SG1 TaxID=2810348 RepID=UPI00202565C3|nr:DNA cytosine methyltransferase [Mycoplasma sp. SG1]URM52740.1 DNA cytosine methyltransferase [Mycoplasma sp. SG1]
MAVFKEKLKIVELFSGIGAPKKALINLKIPHQTLFISEILKEAIDGYNLLYDEVVTNFGDIKSIKKEQIKFYKNNVDFLFMGSPCQDFSHAGKNKGGFKESNTRSSLVWKSLEIISYLKPKIVIFENVKNLLINNNHNQVLKEFLNEMSSMGYFYKYKILNALNYNIPQNRERLFIVFSFDQLIIDKLTLTYGQEVLKSKLTDYLDIKNFEKRYLLEKKPIFNFSNFMSWYDKKGNKNGSYNRAWKIDKYCGTISYSNIIKITDGSKVSQLSALESLKLMGFSSDDYLKLSKKINDKKIISLSGNSIVVKILEKLIEEIVIISESLQKSPKDISTNQRLYL